MHRKLMSSLGALGLAVALAACGASTNDESEDAGDGPIKIALIPPSSGALAQYGTDAVKGWKLAVDQVNADGGINGQKVDLIEKSTDATPANTLREARAAATQDGAKFIGAVMTSPEHGALNAQLDALGVLSLSHLGKDDGLIGEQCSANAFHISQTNGMDINALATQLAEISGDKFAIQAVDYVTGHGAAEIFKAAAEKAGKEIVLEQFAPLDTTDFGSYITKIQQSDADSLFAAEYGADGVAFVKQATQFKLSEKIKTVIGFNLVSEPLFPVLGDGIEGYYSNVGYDVNADNTLNEEFVAAYTEVHDTPPYFVPADAYLAAQTLFAGIEKAGSSDPEKVKEALNGHTFDSIVGEVTVRADDNQLLRPTYLGQVEKGAGGLAFKILGEAAPDQTTPEASSDCEL